MELVHDEQRLATLFLEGHRGDGPTAMSFVIGPGEARVRRHFDVPTEELHGLCGIGAERETVPAPDTNIHLAGKQGQARRLRYPPPLEQLGLGPRLEHDARRAVECSPHDELTLGLPFHRRAVLHRGGLTLSSCVHRISPSVSVPRQPCPTHRIARSRAGGTSRSTPSRPPAGAAPACRSALGRPSLCPPDRPPPG